MIGQRRMASMAQRLPFRLAVAAALLLMQLWTVSSFAEDRFQLPFNTRPGEPPTFFAPAIEYVSHNWDRLVVSRWDSAHYISLVLRGYSQCPVHEEPALESIHHCNLNFYPGYAALGWLVKTATHLPADHSLLLLSLVSSFLFLFLWTDPVIVRALGVKATYVSLLLFNVFPTAFTLVTVQTEPCTLVFTLGAFLAFARRHNWLAALLAGAASGMRVSGAATGAALAIAIVWRIWQDRPERVRDWIGSWLAAASSCWGLLAIVGYHTYRFHDPLMYIHAHARTYAHSGSFASLLDPKTEWLLRSIDHPLHEGVILAFSVVWFLLGRKQAMAGFTVPERVFWYTLALLGTGISLVGSIELGLSGMNRYLLLILPLFFAMGAFMKSRPLLLAFWIAISFWHYRQVDLCDYVGGVGEHRFGKCNVPQWVGHW